MNPGIGAPELLVLAILALVVVGPKELPLLMRKIGRMVGQARGMAREFMRGFDELGRQAELDELRREIEALKRADPVGEARRSFEKEIGLKDIEAEMTGPPASPRAGVEAAHPRTADAPVEAEPPAEDAGEDALEAAARERAEGERPR